MKFAYNKPNTISADCELYEIWRHEVEQSNKVFCLNDIIGKNLYAFWRNTGDEYAADGKKFELSSATYKSFIITDKTPEEISAYVAQFNRALKVKKLSIRIVEDGSDSHKYDDEPKESAAYRKLQSFEWCHVGTVEDINSYAHMRFKMHGNYWKLFIHGGSNDSNIVYLSPSKKIPNEHFGVFREEKIESNIWEKYGVYAYNSFENDDRYAQWVSYNPMEDKSSIHRRPWSLDSIKELTEDFKEKIDFYNIGEGKINGPFQRDETLILKIKCNPPFSKRIHYLNVDSINACDSYYGLEDCFYLHKFSELSYGTKQYYTSSKGSVFIVNEHFDKDCGFCFEYKLRINEKTKFFEDMLAKKSLDPIAYLAWKIPDKEAEMQYISIAKKMVKKAIANYMDAIQKAVPGPLKITEGF